MRFSLSRYAYRITLAVAAAWFLIIFIFFHSNDWTQSSIEQQIIRDVNNHGHEKAVLEQDHLNLQDKNLLKNSKQVQNNVVNGRPERLIPPNVDDEEFDIHSPGEMGKPVEIDKEKLLPSELKKYDEGFEKHAFNEYVSDLISKYRVLPDVRDPDCRKISYESISITASVVMCFHNEAWSVLLRSIHSIITHSPSHLLKEIILVDDFSDMGKMRLFLEL